MLNLKAAFTHLTPLLDCTQPLAQPFLSHTLSAVSSVSDEAPAALGLVADQKNPMW